MSQEDKEQKRLEQLRRRQENAKLLEEESAGLKVATKTQPVSNKVTRAQIAENKRQMEAEGTYIPSKLMS